MACLSRSVIGMAKDPLGNFKMIVTLPGKPKAVQENFTILNNKGILKHALSQMLNTDLH